MERWEGNVLGTYSWALGGAQKLPYGIWNNLNPSLILLRILMNTKY